MTKKALARLKEKYPTLPDATCLKMAAKRLEDLNEKMASLHGSGLGKVHPEVVPLQAEIDTVAGIIAENENAKVESSH